MTIIKPHRTFSLRFFLEAALYALAGLAVLYGVWLYNAAVNLSHEVEIQAKTLETARVRSAELKNQLFDRLDSSELQALAEEHGLVRERSPKYFESDPRWLSASR